LYKPVLDSWMLFDNSENIPRAVAKEKSGKIEIFDQECFTKMLKAAEG